MVRPSTRRNIVAKSISVGALISSISGCLGTARRSEQEQPITDYDYYQTEVVFETFLPNQYSDIESQIVCTENMFIGLLKNSGEIIAFREDLQSELIAQFLNNIDESNEMIAVISDDTDLAYGEWKISEIVQKNKMVHVDFNIEEWTGNGHTASPSRTIVIRLPHIREVSHLSVKAIGHKSLTTNVGTEL